MAQRDTYRIERLFRTQDAFSRLPIAQRAEGLDMIEARLILSISDTCTDPIYTDQNFKKGRLPLKKNLSFSLHRLCIQSLRSA